MRCTTELRNRNLKIAHYDSQYVTYGHVIIILTILLIVTVTVPSAHLTAHLNIPQITWSANSFDLSDKSLFRTLVRTVGPLSESGTLLVTMFNDFKWEKIGLLHLDYGKLE